MRIFISRPIDIAPLVGIQQIQATGVGLHRQRSIEGDRGLALLRALGRDDDDTIGSLRTIDGGRGGIFQHLDRLYVIAVDNGTGVLTGHHTVDHVKRAVGIATERGGTTDRGSGAKSTRRTIGRHGHTGYTTLQRLHDITCRHVGHIFHFNDRDRTGQIGFLFGRVTYYHHFTQSLRILLQLDVELRSGLHGYGDESYVGDRQT